LGLRAAIVGASVAIEYIEIFYNRQRMHSALNIQTPNAFDAILDQSITAMTESPVY